VAFAAAGALTIAMLAGAFIAWNRQEPFMTEDEVAAATAANGIAAGLDSGVPLAFLVNDADETVSFLAARAGNVIRAAVPPDRIRDVVVVVPPVPGGTGRAERLALERLSAGDLRDAEWNSGRPAAAFVLTPFNEIDHPEGATVIDPEAGFLAPAPSDPLEPSSSGTIALSSMLVLVLVAAVGYGWARVGSDDPIRAAAIAPAAGAAVLVLVGVALDRFGLRIGGAAGAWLVSAIAGGGGYLAWGVLERRARPRPAPQVE
jgi:hypothetical protein